MSNSTVELSRWLPSETYLMKKKCHYLDSNPDLAIKNKAPYLLATGPRSTFGLKLWVISDCLLEDLFLLSSPSILIICIMLFATFFPVPPRSLPYCCLNHSQSIKIIAFYCNCFRSLLISIALFVL